MPFTFHCSAGVGVPVIEADNVMSNCASTVRFANPLMTGASATDPLPALKFTAMFRTSIVVGSVEAVARQPIASASKRFVKYVAPLAIPPNFDNKAPFVSAPAYSEFVMPNVSLPASVMLNTSG